VEEVEKDTCEQKRNCRFEMRLTLYGVQQDSDNRFMFPSLGNFIGIKAEAKAIT